MGVAFFPGVGAGAAGFAAAVFTLFAGFSAALAAAFFGATAVFDADFGGAAGARLGLLAALFAAAVLFFALVTTCRLPLLGVGPGVRVLP